MQVSANRRAEFMASDAGNGASNFLPRLGIQEPKGDSDSACNPRILDKAKVRKTFLADYIDSSKAEPLALLMADRRAFQDAQYKRETLSEARVMEIKMKWQTKQMKRLSNSAYLYGPRESTKDLWEFVQRERNPSGRSMMDWGDSFNSATGRILSFQRTPSGPYHSKTTTADLASFATTATGNRSGTPRKSITMMVKGLLRVHQGPSAQKNLVEYIAAKAASGTTTV